MQILFYIPGPFLSNFITQMNNFDNLIEKFSDYFITSAHVYGHYFLCVCWCCSIVVISVYANCPIYYFINQLYIDWLTNQYFRGINIHFLSKNNKKKAPKENAQVSRSSFRSIAYGNSSPTQPMLNIHLAFVTKSLIWNSLIFVQTLEYHAFEITARRPNGRISSSRLSKPFRPNSI